MADLDALLPYSRYLSRLFAARPSLRGEIEACLPLAPEPVDVRALVRQW